MTLRTGRNNIFELFFPRENKAHKHKLSALVNVQMALGQTAGCPRVKRAKKFMCSQRNTGNINFSLLLTGGLSQGCPDFQKVYVFRVYVPFSCPIFGVLTEEAGKRRCRNKLLSKDLGGFDRKKPCFFFFLGGGGCCPCCFAKKQGKEGQANCRPKKRYPLEMSGGSYNRAPQKGPEKWCRAKIVEKCRKTF